MTADSGENHVSAIKTMSKGPVTQLRLASSRILSLLNEVGFVKTQFNELRQVCTLEDAGLLIFVVRVGRLLF